MNIRSRFFTLMICVCVFLLSMPSAAQADSLPIPGIALVVEHPPRDLKIEFLVSGEWVPAYRSKDLWKTSYEYSDWNLDKKFPTFVRASYAGKSVQIAIPPPENEYAYSYT